MNLNIYIYIYLKKTHNKVNELLNILTYQDRYCTIPSLISKVIFYNRHMSQGNLKIDNELLYIAISPIFNSSKRILIDITSTH